MIWWKMHLLYEVRSLHRQLELRCSDGSAAWYAAEVELTRLRTARTPRLRALTSSLPPKETRQRILIGRNRELESCRVEADMARTLALRPTLEAGRAP